MPLRNCNSIPVNSRNYSTRQCSIPFQFLHRCLQSQPTSTAAGIHRMNTPSGTQLLKKELRKQIRSVLASLPQESIAKESAETCARLISMQAYQQASTIALYSSMPQEFDTSVLLADAFSNKKRVFLPRVISKKDHDMAMIEVYSLQDLGSFPQNDWGIREPPLEPDRCKTPDSVSLDLIIVPGLAFDVHGARCGQGMGFYDRFFQKYAASARPMPRLIALALSVQIVTSVPLSSSDWPVDQVIFTEKS